MNRWLYSHRQVLGRPSALESRLRRDLPALLREATSVDDDGEFAGDGSFRIRLETTVLGLHAAKFVRVRSGIAGRNSDGRLRIPLTWRADPGGAVFPTFDGAIELDPLSDWTAQVALVGTYEVPLGIVGDVVDAGLLAGATERTGQRLVDGLAEALARVAPQSETEHAAGRVQPLRVSDVMTRDPIVFGESTNLRTAALVLFHRRISGAPVVADDGNLVGVISERDLLDKEAGAPKRRRRGALRRAEARTVGEACSRPARTTVPDVLLHDAAAEMQDHGVGRLVVIDESSVAGIVTRHDVLRALLRTEDELEAAVDEVLESLGQPHVDAVVVWGDVVLSGSVLKRSELAAVFDAVRGVDGVVSVEGELDWQQDDLPMRRPLNTVM